MTSRLRVFASSVGTKLLIAISGLVLFAYLILHLAGNALVFFGPSVFNEYSHQLISNPLVVPAEIGLLVIFVVHIYKTVKMWFGNQVARPVKYAQKSWAGAPSRKSLASSTMIVTGLILLLFVIQHVSTFKFGPYYRVAGTEVRDLYRLELEIFSNPLTVGFYVLCMVIVGFHLWHGVSSAFQSLGVDHPTHTPRIRAAGWIMAVVIAGGFVTIALWVHVFGGGRS
jgi:succinate dehydrogenase / fumarate reductase, cytochrome b subunit